MDRTARATDLRRRSRHLRELAEAIEQLAVFRLDQRAGEETWRGRRPRLCLAVLGSNQHQLLTAADQLRETAMRFEREADAIDTTPRVGADAAFDSELAG